MTPTIRFFAFASFTAVLVPCLSADPVFPRLPNEPGMKAEDTDQWKPVPTIVTAPAGGIPSDAKVLFDGRSLDAWSAYKDGSPAPWKLEAGAVTIVGTGFHWSVSSAFIPGSFGRRGNTGSAERHGTRTAVKLAKAKKRIVGVMGYFGLTERESLPSRPEH